MFRRHFGERMHPLTSATVVFPLVLIYQLGILASPSRNGADLLTDTMIRLSEHSLQNYTIGLAAASILYLALLLFGSRTHRLSPQATLPTIVESGIYAMSMGSLILMLMQVLKDAVPGLSLSSGQTPLDILVISAGAGVHEELVFRVLGCGLAARLLALFCSPAYAWTMAIGLSSLAFSAAHHVGELGEAFTLSAFVFRFFAGVFFAIVYKIRGAGVAVWTHALYDAWVFTLL